MLTIIGLIVLALLLIALLAIACRVWYYHVFESGSFLSFFFAWSIADFMGQILCCLVRVISEIALGFNAD